MRRSERIGKRYGRLTALRFLGNRRWLCRCDCGVEKAIRTGQLASGQTSSCGCYRVERGRIHGSTINRRHGEGSNGKESAEYRAWSSMKNRCSSPTSLDYARYGGRGILVCDRWQRFEEFLSDMGRRPSSKHSIDRIDVNGNYELANCRWATATEQNRNTSSNHMVTIDEEAKSLSEWLEIFDIARKTFHQRVRSGMSEVDALTVPKRSNPKSNAQREDSYLVWIGMRQRCLNPNNQAYPRYGGRGIRICDRWISYTAFCEDMGPRPPKHSIDRIDNDGNYCPENCRWATNKEQAQNTNGSRMIEINGVTQSLSMWLAHYKRNPATFHGRERRGWSAKDALEKPMQRTGRKPIPNS